MTGLPQLADVLEDLHQARPAVAAIRRKIRSAVERLQFGGEKDIERPAALTAHRLDEGHVYLVHVRSLFPVRFDADEVLIEKLGDLNVFKRLAFHDVTPVAGGVADAQEDRL